MSATDTLEPPRRTLRQTSLYFLTWVAVFAILAWAAGGADLRFADLVENSDNMMLFGKGFFPPNFDNWRMLLDEMLVTVQIAIWVPRWRWLPPSRSASCRRRTWCLGGSTSRSAA